MGPWLSQQVTYVYVPMWYFSLIASYAIVNRFFSIVITLLEIGSGWIPALLNNEAEHAFVVKSQRVLSNNLSYWIGGSAITTGDIDFFHYFLYQTNPGEINLFCWLNDWQHLHFNQLIIFKYFILSQNWQYKDINKEKLKN